MFTAFEYCNISDSALFRSLDNEGGVTLILDEIDKLDKQAKSNNRNSTVVTQRGAQVTRTEGPMEISQLKDIALMDQSSLVVLVKIT